MPDVRLVALVTLAMLGALPNTPARVSGATGGEPLGVQQCTTRCQTDYTDCVDRCDGSAPCNAGCDREVLACVQRCTTPPTPPAPSAAPPTPSAAPAPTDD